MIWCDEQACLGPNILIENGKCPPSVYLFLRKTHSQAGFACVVGKQKEGGHTEEFMLLDTNFIEMNAKA